MEPGGLLGRYGDHETVAAPANARFEHGYPSLLRPQYIPLDPVGRMGLDIQSGHDGQMPGEVHPRKVSKFRSFSASDAWRSASVTLVPHRARGEGMRDGDAEGEVEGQAGRNPEA